MDRLREIGSPEFQESESHQWYVMAPIYFQETTIKSYLDKKGIRCYLPTKTGIKTLNGKKRIVEVPIINSLLFVYTTESELKEICVAQPYLYYKYDKTNGISRKMTVPIKQMEDFLRISSLEDREVSYYNPQTVNLNLERGIPVRIHCCNPKYNGAEGIYTRIEGKRNKQLVITLNGQISLTMTLNAVDVIEKL